ncbi:hypothetical protein BJ508DRAFT_313448 [Ascobolus immersus RN42]|uniref:Uncharacterized protein n=1 Tax=Ascobolus immersus RN42 TaxID=1160509 RepID=A0A3N4HPR2_ASCIM|nr:hypothetical protein BJ508DRAFT_313448 [Ascobolus immersus RN42]
MLDGPDLLTFAAAAGAIATSQQAVSMTNVGTTGATHVRAFVVGSSVGEDVLKGCLDLASLHKKPPVHRATQCLLNLPGTSSPLNFDWLYYPYSLPSMSSHYFRASLIQPNKGGRFFDYFAASPRHPSGSYVRYTCSCCFCRFSREIAQCASGFAGCRRSRCADCEDYCEEVQCGVRGNCQQPREIPLLQLTVEFDVSYESDGTRKWYCYNKKQIHNKLIQALSVTQHHMIIHHTVIITMQNIHGYLQQLLIGCIARHKKSPTTSPARDAYELLTDFPTYSSNHYFTALRSSISERAPPSINAYYLCRCYSCAMSKDCRAFKCPDGCDSVS